MTKIGRLFHSYNVVMAKVSICETCDAKVPPERRVYCMGFSFCSDKCKKEWARDQYGVNA